jgi:hypothetical protein
MWVLAIHPESDHNQLIRDIYTDAGSFSSELGLCVCGGAGVGGVVGRDVLSFGKSGPFPKRRHPHEVVISEVGRALTCGVKSLCMGFTTN